MACERSDGAAEELEGEEWEVPEWVSSGASWREQDPQWAAGLDWEPPEPGTDQEPGSA